MKNLRRIYIKTSVHEKIHTKEMYANIINDEQQPAGSDCQSIHKS